MPSWRARPSCGGAAGAAQPAFLFNALTTHPGTDLNQWVPPRAGARRRSCASRRRYALRLAIWKASSPPLDISSRSSSPTWRSYALVRRAPARAHRLLSVAAHEPRASARPAATPKKGRPATASRPACGGRSVAQRTSGIVEPGRATLAPGRARHRQPVRRGTCWLVAACRASSRGYVERRLACQDGEEKATLTFDTSRGHEHRSRRRFQPLRPPSGTT